MKYADLEGLTKKDSFKKGLVDLLRPTAKNLLKHRLRIVSESLGEPAVLIEFLDEDFYLAFKTDGVGTKSLIADKMTTQGDSIANLYSGLGIDLIASNVNDLICLGAVPIALSDEISAGNYRFFTDQAKTKSLFRGLKRGCQEAGITIPCGESPTLTDILRPQVMNITGSAIGIVKPKNSAIFGRKLKVGDSIFGLASNGIHTNGLMLARKIVEKLPQGYLAPFGQQTLGEALLKPTRIYVKPILEMLKKKIEIHYMSNITGSAFRKIMRAKKDFSYLIEKLPRRPRILKYLQETAKIPNNEAYETWNMGLGFVIFAPKSEEEKIAQICKKYKITFFKLGYVKPGPKKVIIKPINIIYE